MNGICYKDGCEYVTDGHWLYKICEYYAKENEGRFIRADGVDVTEEVRTPAYDKVLERFKTERQSYSLADLITIKDFENIYKHFTHYKNKTLFENHSVLLDIGCERLAMNMYTLKAVLLFWRSYPKARLYAHAEENKPFFLTDGANTCAFCTMKDVLDWRINWHYSTKDEIVKKIA